MDLSRLLRKEDFTNNEAYLAYKYQQEESKERIVHLLDVVEDHRKASFAWKIARTVSLFTMVMLMSNAGAPWYHYVVLLITTSSCVLSEVFAE